VVGGGARFVLNYFTFSQGEVYFILLSSKTNFGGREFSPFGACHLRVFFLELYPSYDRMPGITRILVLMLENRSFDHLLGNLPNVDGLQNAPKSLPRSLTDPSLGNVSINSLGLDTCVDDPFHTFDPTTEKINNNNMDGFVAVEVAAGKDESNVVSMFTPDTAPIINQLAEEFAVFDSWFSSVPTCTDPNRQFAMSGTSGGTVTNFDGKLLLQQTYFDYLNQRNVTAGGYYQDDFWTFGYFEDLQKEENAALIKPLDDFWDDVKNDKLPSYTWLQPRMTVNKETGDVPTWQHPDASISEGERLLKKVYESLRASERWNETLLVLTYDEYGGYFDHVPPPSCPPPDDKTDGDFAFNRLGVRIPTVAISPRIKKGVVVHDALEGEKPTPTSQFESTSMMATFNKLFGLDNEPPLSKRMEWANSFASLMDNEFRTDTPETLKDIPEIDLMAESKFHSLKPVNEHLETQAVFFCRQNYPEQFKVGEICDAAKPFMNNQGDASAFLRREQVKWLLKRDQRIAVQRELTT